MEQGHVAEPVPGTEEPSSGPSEDFLAIQFRRELKCQAKCSCLSMSDTKGSCMDVSNKVAVEKRR